MNEPLDAGAAASVLDSIRALLNAEGVAFVEKAHAPTFTSEESARARGEALKIGAKALVMKTDDRYRLFVLPADRRVDSPSIKRQLGVKKMRFADAAELMELTGLVPGSVPPFGIPILPLELIADPALGNNEKIAFNAGSLTTSIVMPFGDYQRLSGARWLAFSQPG
jgi:prolyl-tRNA editing enzyme YbaK/EbsC (Cys-tRNA(Pro) deacylase)